MSATQSASPSQLRDRDRLKRPLHCAFNLLPDVKGAL